MQAIQLIHYTPGIKAALNKTEYFMNQLRDIQPHIAEQLEPVSEYVKAKEKMLFKNKFGIVSVTPDNLLHRHEPNIKSAEFELKLKQIIKSNLYVPKRWEHKTSTETFTNELLPTIKENLIYDIVSTSDESQSSTNKSTDIK